jgi:ubiquitin C-terminal hydrolase
MRVECTKKIELWKSPNILVIHFKRFKYTAKENKKIDVFIDFPLQNLDLREYLSSTQKETPVYDLFAVAVKKLNTSSLNNPKPK